MKRTLALGYGLFAYLLFVGTFAYAVGFVGNLGVPKSIDSGASSTALVAVAIDSLLLGLFAVQHSVMARQGFKRQWTRIVPRSVERSTYVLVASLTLDFLLWQWRPLPDVLWDVRGTFAGGLMWLLFWLGWGVLLTSTFLVNHFELFGLAHVWAYFHRYELWPPSFRTPGLYRYVRHPLYAGFVIAFWSAPVMTVGHLFFSIATTGYILLGIYFEERDLLRAHGRAYHLYRQRVPMLIPFLKKREGSDKPLPDAHRKYAS